MSQTHNVVVLASFIVIVPFPLFTLNVPGTSSSYIISGIAVAATVASFLVLKNNRSQKRILLSLLTVSIILANGSKIHTGSPTLISSLDDFDSRTPQDGY